MLIVEGLGLPGDRPSFTWWVAESQNTQNVVIGEVPFHEDEASFSEEAFTWSLIPIQVRPAE
jgi:hypothetical protein